MAGIGIMGGSFDPVHLGHIGVAESALKECNLDEVVFMPAYIQPFKQDVYVAEAEHRLEMLKRATVHEERFSVSTWEMDKEKVSYTYDTIQYFIKERKNEKVFFLMGSDSLMTVEDWYKGPELLGLCSFIVGLRPTNDREKVTSYAEKVQKEYHTEIYLLKELMIPISSTMIRNKIANKEPISGLVSPMVEEYIYEQELYI